MAYNTQITTVIAIDKEYHKLLKELAELHGRKHKKELELLIKSEYSKIFNNN